MSWPAIHRIRLAQPARRRVAPRLCAVAVALIALLPVAQPARAATAPDTCFLSGATCAYLPPALLNLNGLYAATAAQRQSLQTLETTAISNTLADHGLPVTDRDAVASWGRASAEAELFGLLKGAIATPATARTPDQQNAVDWFAAIEQREAVTAAQNAGLEYAKWAGLDQTAYRNLLLNNASQGDLQTFLSTTPEGALHNGGFCSYQAPAPYSTEYDPTNNAALCASNTGGGLGCVFSCVPTTPSYDQFVKWGEAAASNASLSSSQTELVASSIAAGLVFGGVAVGAGVSGVALSTGLASALIGTALQEAILPYAALMPYVADLADLSAEALAEAVAENVAITSAEIATDVGVITGVLIAAITTAVVEGINVTNATALPGKLATLIANAEATPPDPATLLTDTNGMQSLFSLFVGATLPAPASGTCAGCLNAPAIPQPAFSDPYFIDADTQIPGPQVGSSSYTQTPSGPTTHTTTNSITVADYTRGITETARLSGSWFVLQPNGASAPTQSLSIAYTDWDGRQQVAWVVGSLTDGYQFVGYDATDGKSQGLDPATCLANHICWKAHVLDYVGVDGNLHEAAVQTPSAATATVSYHDAFYNQPFAAYDGDPTIFAVTNPDPTVDYTWEFEQTPPCPGAAFGCLTVQNGFAAPPDYTAPLDDPGGALSQSGAVAHRWETSGQYRVRLTETDQSGRSTASTFTVNVADQGPSITEDVFPQAYQAGVPFYPGMIYGQITHQGTNDDEIVTLDWGDGSTDTATIGPDFAGLGGIHLGVGGTLNPASGLTLTTDTTGNVPLIKYAYAGPHTYAEGGVYHVTVAVLDQGGLTASQTRAVTVYNQRPTLSSLAPLSAPIGGTPTLTIGGSGFVPGATVQVNGAPITTTYVSPTAVTAQVPATATASLAVDTITVENPVPDVGPSNPQVLYITPPGSLAASVLATSAAGSASAVVGGHSNLIGGVGQPGTPGTLSAVASGAGSLALAQYTTAPLGTTPPAAANAYFDVFTPASTFGSVQVQDCNLGGDSLVYSYDSTTGQWTPVSGQTYNAGAGCVSFTLDGGSAPSLSQLTRTGGVVFGVGNAPPVVTDPGAQSVPYGGPVSIPVSATDAEATDQLTLRASGLPAGLSLHDNGAGTGTVSGTVTAPVGVYTATLSANDGYGDATPVTVPFTVTPAPLTITASSPRVIYTGAVPAITPSYSGFVNNERASALTTPPTCAATAPRSGAAGTYTTSCTGAVDANYRIGYAPGTLTITKADTSVTVAAAPASSVFGQPVTVTATVAVQSPGAGQPGGTVEFTDGGSDIGGCAAQPVDTTTGTAICATSSLSVATHSITATYSGDPNVNGSSTAAAVTQTVTKAATRATLASSAAAVTVGQPVTVTAMVAAVPPGAGTPTGPVTFTDGATTLGTGTLSASGGVSTGSVKASSLSVGTHAITATYGGDGHFLASTAVTLTQYINTNLSGYPTLPGGAYNLSNANLAGGYFVNAPLAGASLSGANLTGAVFSGANLTGANLSNSNLKGATFSGANLTGANLSNSNLKGATFSGVNLSGVNFSNSNLMGATGLKSATLTGVIWSKTACPDGTTSNQDGGTCLGHL